MDQVILMLGTHKGAFFLRSSGKREVWTLDGPYLQGYPVEYLTADTRQGVTFYASVTNPFYGPALHMSQDLGYTWHPMPSSPRFEKEREKTVERIWVVEPGLKDTPEILYAGVDPGALFFS